MFQTLNDCEEVLSQNSAAVEKDNTPDIKTCINKFQNDFVASMSDDLHTPVVLAALSDPLKIINDLLHTRKVFWFEFHIVLIVSLYITTVCLKIVAGRVL